MENVRAPWNTLGRTPSHDRQGGADALLSVPFRAAAQEPLLGEIKWVPYNFAPRGWADCNGQLMSIAQNTALFSLLGTTFGGDGRSG